MYKPTVNNKGLVSNKHVNHDHDQVEIFLTFSHMYYFKGFIIFSNGNIANIASELNYTTNFRN